MNTYRVEFLDGSSASVEAESFRYVEIRGALWNVRFFVDAVPVAEFSRELVKGVYQVSDANEGDGGAA
jgi:hypothetical protein